jgi:hypothetical protein
VFWRRIEVSRQDEVEIQTPSFTISGTSVSAFAILRCDEKYERNPTGNETFP